MTTPTTQEDIVAAECLLFLAGSRESNQTPNQYSHVRPNTEHSTQSTLSLPSAHVSGFGQRYTPVQLSPPPQLAYPAQFYPQAQLPQAPLPPHAQLPPRTQLPPRKRQQFAHPTQFLPRAQNPPQIQNTPQVQNLPQVQDLAQLQNLAQVQLPHLAQLLSRAQDPPRAQNLAQAQNPPQAQHHPRARNSHRAHNSHRAQNPPRAQHPPRVQLPPGRSNIVSTPSGPLNIPQLPQVSNQPQRSSAVPNQQAQPFGANLSPELALQAFLIRQQLIAGIPPQDIIPMRQQSSNAKETVPAIVQITNEGIRVPNIPPAKFSGSFQPIPKDQLASISLQPAGAREARPQIAAQTRAPSNTFVPATSANALTPEGTEARTVQQQPRAMGRPEARAVSQQPRATGHPDANTLPQQPRIISRPEARILPQQPRDIAPPALNMAPTHGAETQPSPQPQISNIPHEGFDLLRRLSYHPQLAISLTSYLDVNDIVSIGALSKPFHQFLSAHIGHVISTHAATRYPYAAITFPFLCYPKLCTQPRHWCDPQPQDGQYNLDLLVPSIPWIRMLAYRDNTVRDIMILLHQAGYNLPSQAATPILKLWALMDIPDNERREWTIRNRHVWQDGDIFLATLFLVQLDMYLRQKRDQQSNSIRRLIMAQPTLTFLHDYIQRTVLQSPTHVLTEYVRWKYAPDTTRGEADLFGVSVEDAGSLQYEWYGKRRGRGVGEETRIKLRRPDECILLELRRRGLSPHDMYIEFFVCNRGHIFFPLNKKSVSWVAQMRGHVAQKGGNWMDAVRLD
ncbi:titin [Aspergillus awamori]|uniref:Titin n=1 Tax=Aspergillus awamori TaxID=105351 RepID=A0A401KJT1_ASPAW|nr:titin [Aspergillus awamori]GKZ62870.1 hypothetical protein AnigIFM49718_010599 [Aspergillus niger]